MTEDWRVVTEQPAVLADALDVMIPLGRLRYANPRPEGRKRFVMLRWADVIRRFSPDDAWAVLEEELPTAPETHTAPHLTEEAVRAATLLEMGKHEEAKDWVMRVSTAGGARALLEGRVALQTQRLPEARAFWELAEAAARSADWPLAVEVEIEALGNLARLDAMAFPPSHAGFRRMETRCKELNAGVTQSVFRTLEEMSGPTARELRAERTSVAIRAHMEKTYAEPFVDDVPKLGPVPLHVHGMAKIHKVEPMKFVEAVSGMASVLWKEGDRQRSYETAWYGRAIGTRLFGPKVEAALTEFLELLLAPLPEERRQAFDVRLRLNALGDAEA